MNRKILAICDLDAEYAERFSRYAAKRENGVFEILTFTDPDALDAYLHRGGADIMLAAREMLTPEADAAAGGKIRQLFLLSEFREERREDYPVIYKYQSSERILREALRSLDVEPSGPENRKAEICGVYSPVKRCYKTTFALILGQVLAEQGPALYLNLEDVSGFPALLGKEYEENLSDLLYSWQVEQPGQLRFRSTVQNVGRLAYIPPVGCPGDIRTADPAVIAEIAAAIAAADAYRYLVIDVGDALRDPLPVLSLCSRIYMPVKEDAAAQAKAEAWTAYLREREEEEILARIRKIVLPRYAGLAGGCADYRSLLSNPFGRYVEKQVREEEGWN